MTNAVPNTSTANETARLRMCRIFIATPYCLTWFLSSVCRNSGQEN